MSLTTILCQVEPGDAAMLDAAVATPFALAEAHGAQLTALVFGVEAEHTIAAEEQAAAMVRTAAERRGIPCETRSRSSFAYGVGDVFADHLRVSDLGVVVTRAGGGAVQRLMLGAAIFDSGRPVLVVQQQHPLEVMPARVVIAWDATPACVRAVHGAMPFIRRAAETLVVTVTDDKELRAGQSGIELTHLLARHGATARFTAVPRAGGGVPEAVLGAAPGGPGQMLVMGAVRHAPLHNIVFGSATQELFDRGPRLPTLVAA
ncbi:universal stress protein [Sediminicoccus rosea]|uniref:Universal stress protein n=1 Tax=Sediminicoccus rosea TaxID=1225128 RepID=A0ABZ0PCC2_9PROT|nr:universal stress protein [Sediminicoccus rosea]WPB82941.1 universal stress protein [Sediminicoccus rosea]